MKQIFILTLVILCTAINVKCQEMKMDCYDFSSESVTCILKASKTKNDTLFAFAPLNCNVYNFDSTANGCWKIFAPDSTTLIEISNVENGVRNGLSNDFYPNGKKKSELLYWQGKIDEHVRTYYWDNGKIARFEAHTSNSKGTSEYYNREGQSIDAETFLLLWCK